MLQSDAAAIASVAEQIRSEATPAFQMPPSRQQKW
jgi:hypothetical protein